MNSVKEVLSATLELFKHPSAFLIGDFAHSQKEWKEDDSWDCNVLDPRADCWCLTGGICKVMGLEPFVPFVPYSIGPSRETNPLLAQVYQALYQQLPARWKKSEDPEDYPADLENFSDAAGYDLVVALLQSALAAEE